MRRTLGLAGAAALALAAVPATAATLDELTAPVAVTGGDVVGVIEGGVASFRGIPFAAPPVRENRWRDPQPVEAWDGALIADRYGPMCMQGLRAKHSIFYLGEEPTSARLTLNVWTAADAKPGDGRPVMVFVYGGGWVVGSASMPLYEGTALAEKGAVVVSFNYRVGSLGFLAHPELTAESADGTSGNYGLKDMLAALAWVRDNAGAFGGDPGNVTLYGQSAGAAGIAYLMASPEAEGLFHAAIGQSGGYPMGGTMASLADAEAKGAALAGTLKADSLTALRNLGADAVMAGGNFFTPIVDGRVLAEQPSAVYAEGRQMAVPLLVGSNADEATVYPVVKSPEDFVAAAKEGYGDRADALLALYPAGDAAAARDLSYKLHRDRLFASAVMDWAADQSRVAPTWVYYFDRAHPLVPRAYQQQQEVADFGAYHGAEMAYAYGTLDAFNRDGETRAWTDADRALSETLLGYWSAFAAAHDPNGEGRPEWPGYEPAVDGVLLIGDTVEAGTFPNRAMLDVLKAPAGN